MYLLIPGSPLAANLMKQEKKSRSTVYIGFKRQQTAMETRFQALYPSSPLQSTIGTLSPSSIQTKKIDDFGKQKRSQRNCRSHQRELQRLWHSLFFFFFDRTKERKSASGFHRTHMNFHSNFLCLNKLFSRFHFFVFSQNPKTPLTRFLSFLHRSCSQIKRHYYSKDSKCPILRLLGSYSHHTHTQKFFNKRFQKSGGT